MMEQFLSSPYTKTITDTRQVLMYFFTLKNVRNLNIRVLYVSSNNYKIFLGSSVKRVSS